MNPIVNVDGAMLARAKSQQIIMHTIWWFWVRVRRWEFARRGSGFEASLPRRSLVHRSQGFRIRGRRWSQPSTTLIGAPVTKRHKAIARLHPLQENCTYNIGRPVFASQLLHLFQLRYLQFIINRSTDHISLNRAHCTTLIALLVAMHHLTSLYTLPQFTPHLTLHFTSS